MYNQPYGFPAMPSQQSGTNDIQGMRWVSGIDEVKSTPVPWGRAAFMNNQDNLFYVKDAATGTVRTFKFEEVPEPKPETYVTRQEFEQLRSEYERLVQQHASAAQPQQPQPVATVPNDAVLQWDSGTGQAAVHADGRQFGNEQVPIQSTVG